MSFFLLCPSFLLLQLERTRRSNSNLSMQRIHDNKGVVRKASGLPVHGGTTGKKVSSFPQQKKSLACVSFSTATVVVAIRTPQNKWRIMCANTGDSDALLLARQPKRLRDNHKCKHLSVVGFAFLFLLFLSSCKDSFK